MFKVSMKKVIRKTHKAYCNRFKSNIIEILVASALAVIQSADFNPKRT